MKRYSYRISNLDCANCAKTLEDGLNKNSNLKNVIINFTKQTISFDANDITIKELNKMVKAYEPDAKVSEINTEVKREYHLFSLILALVLILIINIFPISNNIKDILIIIAYMLLLYRTFINAIKMLINSHTINENMLISTSCIGAFIINQKMEGLMVITLYVIGKILEEKALNRSRNAINDIVKLKPLYANLKIDKNIKQISVDEIKVNDILIVKKGERIPVDGQIIAGNSFLDTSSLTGESTLKKVSPGDAILSGCINNGDVIEMKATTLYESSTVAKILDLVMNASDAKAKTENTVSKLSKVYTPLILVLALLVLIILPLYGVPLSTSFYRALTFLVISCPCAIAISVPLSYFTGIGTCSNRGILIKGSNYLDDLWQIKSIVFDKTGTLTDGTFKITNIDIIDSSYQEKDIIQILCSGESLSDHPLAKSILGIYPTIKLKKVTNFKEVSGKGISFTYDKNNVLIGTQILCDCLYDAQIHININGKHVASINIDDGIKDNAQEVINKLKELNIKTYMFTGDKEDKAKLVSNLIGINSYKAEMLPQDKYSALEKLKKAGNIVAFVGDGINDAPVIKLADIGIAMGGIGSTSAIEAADVVIMSDDLNKIVTGISISKFTNKIIKENLIFAISTKVIILLLSIFGLTTMWFAIFADTGVTLIAILNTLRITKK